MMIGCLRVRHVLNVSRFFQTRPIFLEHYQSANNNTVTDSHRVNTNRTLFYSSRPQIWPRYSSNLSCSRDMIPNFCPSRNSCQIKRNYCCQSLLLSSNWNDTLGSQIQNNSSRGVPSRSLSNKPPVDPEYEELSKRFKDDPEVKSWIQEIKGDFDENESIPESSSSSSSDSDSSSDSESDSSPLSEEAKFDTGKHLEGEKKNSIDMRQFTDIDFVEDEEYEYEDFYGGEVEYEEDLPEQELPISLERGQTGVYDLEELVTLLREENARDLCVIQIPREQKYVDYMVIVSGRSTRHLKAMSALVRWIYKQRRQRKDPRTVHIEGEHANDWMAMDLGNIALHMFLPETREKYDLETLWTVGSEYDEKSRQEEEEDPFALYVDQAFDLNTLYQNDLTADEASSNGPKEEPKVTLDLESKAGWHGPTSSKL